MTSTEDSTKTDGQPFWMRQAPITIVGVLLLGIIGSTVYDLLVKPGITSFGRFVLNVITLGSTTLRNAAYSSAAIDPTPVSSLILLQAGLVVAAFPAMWLIARARNARYIGNAREKPENAGKDEKEVLAQEIERRMRKVRKLKI